LHLQHLLHVQRFVDVGYFQAGQWALKPCSEVDAFVLSHTYHYTGLFNIDVNAVEI